MLFLIFYENETKFTERGEGEVSKNLSKPHNKGGLSKIDQNTPLVTNGRPLTHEQCDEN